MIAPRFRRITLHNIEDFPSPICSVIEYSWIQDSGNIPVLDYRIIIKVNTLFGMKSTAIFSNPNREIQREKLDWSD